MNKVAKRFSQIANGTNTDASDEYYTLNHCFMAFLIELLARYYNGIKYKVIICPCDGLQSIFRRLEEFKQYIGNPKIIYSFYPEKDWKDYFNMDFYKEYGCKNENVLLFTNPPFKGQKNILKNKLIKCNYLLMGSASTRTTTDIYILNKKSFNFIKNTDLKNIEKYSAIPLIFISNQLFYSYGEQYTQKENTKGTANLFFDKDKLKRVYNNILQR